MIGKPINTSVPSIAIRFHANAEELEELYQSEEESTDKHSNEKTKCVGKSGNKLWSLCFSFFVIGKII